MEKAESISKQECINNVRQACFHFANLYYHFAKVFTDELGKEKSKQLIVKAVKNFAVERGLNLRKRAAELGLDPIPDNFWKVTDIPVIAWESPKGFYCSYGDVWRRRGDIGCEMGLLYCEVNDCTIFKTFNPEWKQIRFTKHLLWGDDHCDRITEYKGKRFEWK